MAGSIVFRSGATWDVSTVLYRRALDSLAAVSKLSEEAIEHLQLAAEFGFLVLADLPESVRDLLMDVIESEEYENHLALAAVKMDGYAIDDTTQLASRLRSLAVRERTYPRWVSCSPDGVIVEGLSADHLADVVGATVWPVLRSDSGETSKLEFKFASLGLTIEVVFSDSAQGSIEFEDAKLAIRSGCEHDEGVVAALADALTTARTRTHGSKENDP